MPVSASIHQLPDKSKSCNGAIYFQTPTATTDTHLLESDISQGGKTLCDDTSFFINERNRQDKTRSTLIVKTGIKPRLSVCEDKMRPRVLSFSAIRYFLLLSLELFSNFIILQHSRAIPDTPVPLLALSYTHPH